METVNFKVSKGEEKTFALNTTSTIENLKDKIKEIYNISCYIDIDFQIDKPMRILGKFNVEPGILARTFDRYELSKFGINRDEIALTFYEVENYTPFKNTKREINLSKYKKEEKKEEKHVSFNIESNDDFPKLG